MVNIHWKVENHSKMLLNLSSLTHSTIVQRKKISCKQDRSNNGKHLKSRSNLVNFISNKHFDTVAVC